MFFNGCYREAFTNEYSIKYFKIYPHTISKNTFLVVKMMDC